MANDSTCSANCEFDSTHKTHYFALKGAKLCSPASGRMSRGWVSKHTLEPGAQLRSDFEKQFVMRAIARTSLMAVSTELLDAIVTVDNTTR